MFCTKCRRKRWFVSNYDGNGYFNKCCACKARFEGLAKAFGLAQRLSAEARKEREVQEKLESKGQLQLSF